MSEHEIQSAFDHLKKDIATNVKTEERLEQITGRRRLRWQPALAALGAAAVVALAIGAGILAILPGNDPEPGPPATSVPDGTTTTVATDSTLPQPALGSVLIAGIDSIPGSQADDYSFIPGERVVSDGSGGVVIQVDNRLVWAPPSGDGGDLVDGDTWTSGPGPVTIRLEDTVLVNGSPRVLFVVSGGTFLTAYNEVWWYDLRSGSLGSIYTLAPAFEESITRVSQAGDLVVVSEAFAGGTSFTYLTAAGDPIRVDGPYHELPGGAPPFPITVEEGVLSPDGTTLAYVESEFRSPDDDDPPVDLVIWDLAAAGEVQRVSIEFSGEVLPGRLDYDGTTAVLGRESRPDEGSSLLAPVRIDLPGGTVTELPDTGTPSLVKIDVR